MSIQTVQTPCAILLLDIIRILLDLILFVVVDQ